MMENDEKQVRSKKKWILWAVILTVVAALLAITLYLADFYRDIQSGSDLFTQEMPAQTPQPTASAPLEAIETAVPTPSPSPTPDPELVLGAEADIDFMKKRVNILLLGIDESAEREDWGVFRTDTMLLLTINFAENDVDMISIPRDSYVKIYDGKGMLYNELAPFNKINAAFAFGGGAKKKGFDYSMTTVSELLQVPVNYYVGFNMNVVKDVVDAMGGVDYDVDTEVSMNGRALHPGQQHLDGQGVLDYCRMRKGSSDIARIDRQQRMLTAIFEQMKSTGQLVNIPDIYQALETNIMTNLTFKQICALSLVAVRMDPAQLERHMVEGSPFTAYRRSCWGINARKLQKLIKEVFNKDVTIDPEVDGTAIQLQIQQYLQQLAPELNRAAQAITQAEALMTYKNQLDSDVYKTLKAYYNNVEDAVEQPDKTMLDTYTPVLEQYCAYVTSLLQSSGVAAGMAGTEGGSLPG